MALRLPENFVKSMAKILRWVATFFALLFVLIFLLILATPTIISSHFIQNRLKSSLSATLQGPVNWSTLQLSWSQGLKIRNFTAGPAVGGLRQARIATLDFLPGFGFGANRDESFGLDLFLHLHDLSLELTPPASTTTTTALAGPPTEEKLDPLTTLAQALDRFATLSFPLPVDLRIDVAIDPITLHYYDPDNGRSVLLQQGSLQLLIPSLERAPLNFNLDGKISVDDHSLGKLHLATQISGLVAPSGRIVPAAVFISTAGEFPGIVMKAEGRLDQEQGLNGELRLELPELQKVTAPFIPINFPKLSGTLLATFHAQVDKADNLALSCTLDGQQLRARGGILPAAGVGPINFDLGQKIKSDHRRQIITLDEGFLKMLPLLSANWEASITAPTSPDRQVKARLQQVQVNLNRLLVLAAPFLPSALPQLAGGRLQLRDLDLHLRGSQGDGTLSLAQAEVLLPSFRHVQSQSEVRGTGIRLVTRELKIPLNAYFPRSATSGVEWQIADLQRRGAQPLALQELAGGGTLAISAIRKGEGKEGLSANGSFTHQLRLKSAEVVALARINDLENDLELVFALLPDGGVKVESLQLQTTIAAVTATVDGKELLPLAISQKLQIDDLELRGGEVLPRVGNFDFVLTSPQLLTLTGRGSLEKERLLTLHTHTQLELPRFMVLARSFLPKGLTAAGTISKEFHLVTTIPDRPLPSGQPPLRSAKSAMALLKEVSGSMQLDGVEAHLPLTNGTLHLSGIRTPQALRWQSRHNGEEIDLSGAIDFDLRAGSVLNDKELPAGHGQFTVNGEVRDWDRAFFAETVQIAAMGMAHRSELSITGLATLLDEAFPPTPATLLQRLDATLFSEIDMNLRTGSLQLFPELTIRGQAFVGTRIDLHAGDSLRLHAYADVADLDLSSAKGLHVKGVQAHFNLDRSLRISSAATSPGRWLPLSTSLVDPLPAALPPPLAGEKRRLHDDRRGNSGGERSLRITALTIPLVPTPLTLQALEAEIATGQEVGMNFLQAELLGGTLRARALLDLRPLAPVLNVEALFTHLDLSWLDSGVTELRPVQAESALSGEFRLRAPLLAEQRPLLEGLILSVRLRHIGSQSLDRILAKLDPYERNEAIMSQRKLLRRGQLQGIVVEVADGALALTGAVKVKGVSIALPKIERLRLAELPLHQELAPVLTAISAARPPLEFVRADTIDIGAQGEISLHKEDK